MKSPTPEQRMRHNPIKTKWARGEPVINGWLGIGSPFAAEIMRQQGYDAITIDLQHGLVGFEGAALMLQALRASGVALMVRAPSLDPAAIMRVLDAGADGVICPMITVARRGMKGSATGRLGERPVAE